MKTIPAKTILSGYADGDTWFGSNYNMNIYKGCCHGCLYCDSRSACYQIENFDEVRVKDNALAIIARELKSKRRTGVIGTGAMSDPYNPFEKDLRLTRGALELIHRYGFGVAIATKSDLVTRDIDVLTSIQKQAPVLVKITVTTADDALCKVIEPNVVVSSRRFAAIKQLVDNGLFAGVLLMPVLPFLEDSDENITAIIEQAHDSGAKFIYPAFGVTLRQNQRDWFFQKLDQFFPGVKAQYLQQFGNAYECRSPRADELGQLLRRECRRRGILCSMADIIAAYKQGDTDRQLSLFQP